MTPFEKLLQDMLAAEQSGQGWSHKDLLQRLPTEVVVDFSLFVRRARDKADLLASADRKLLHGALDRCCLKAL